ncbi:hypothetical protein Pla22_25320 [Rubripirellula amarantea]|uniref:Uncharacterized protein n=1 Tax=Rubripirellula amarantea TaxID=2527999 RepID=A0A5C5WWC2_9BACT|nr:hypothetical protein Pla22_25320 [Rubripirellula amarantea]
MIRRILLLPVEILASLFTGMVMWMASRANRAELDSTNLDPSNLESSNLDSSNSSSAEPDPSNKPRGT